MVTTLKDILCNHGLTDDKDVHHLYTVIERLFSDRRPATTAPITAITGTDCQFIRQVIRSLATSFNRRIIPYKDHRTMRQAKPFSVIIEILDSDTAEFNSSRSRHRYRLQRNIKRFATFCVTDNIAVHPLYAYENVIDEFPFKLATPVIGDETVLCECEKRIIYESALAFMHPVCS